MFLAFLIIYLYSFELTSITFIHTSYLSIVFQHYSSVTTTVLFVFSLNYSKNISFHIKARCPSEKCDSYFHCIFNIVNGQRNHHFKRKPRIKKVFPILWKAMHNRTLPWLDYIMAWRDSKYCFRDPTWDEMFQSWLSRIRLGSDSDSDRQWYIYFQSEFNNKRHSISKWNGRTLEFSELCHFI